MSGREFLRRLRHAVAWRLGLILDLDLARRLSPLAPGPFTRAWIFLVVAGRLPFPLPIRVGNRNVRFFFADRSELLALEQSFLRGEYEIALAAAPRTIVDLGANCGQAALYFRARFPEASILSVEPAAETFSRLQRNIGADARVRLGRCAVTGSDGQVQLRKHDHSWINRVGDEPSTDPTNPQVSVEPVEGVTLERLLDEAGVRTVDLLKVDIEGAEYDALLASPALSRIETLVCEVHERLIPLDKQAFVEQLRADGGFDTSRSIGKSVFVLERRNRVGAGLIPAPPTPPDMRVRIRRFAQRPGNGDRAR